MRLLRLDIEEFRSIKNEWLPADGLVVLFGANSAGKTLVLEAAEHLITQAETFRSDPTEVGYLFFGASVRFALPGADVAGSEDARLYRSLLCGEYANEDIPGSTQGPWDGLEAGLTGQLKNLELAEVISLLADALARAGAAGTREDRELLARSLFAPDAVYFTAGKFEIGLTIHGPWLPGEARDAARRIAAIPDGDDALQKAAVGLVSTGATHISPLAGAAGREKLAAAFPPVIKLDGDLELLSAELQRALPVVHNRLWETEPEVITFSTFSATALDGFEAFAGGESDRYDEDRWLEGWSEHGELVVPEVFGSSGAGDWYRVRHSVLAAAKLIESEANQVAPGFVAEQGTIGIEILPVSVWGRGLPRIRATFTEHGEDEARDLKVVGAGTARWVAAAVRLACRRLEAGRQVVTDDSGMPVSDEAEKRQIVRDARQAALNQHRVRLEPWDAAAVYIADEPEAHLHPAALQSVRQWLTQLAETAATVLVATHSTALLDSTSELVNRVLVRREQHRTHLRHMTGAVAGELAGVADDLGLTQGELLLMTRLALFVEGTHDQIILDEWFGDDLRYAGIRVFPVQGVDNLPGLAESEITAALDIRIATLSDDTSLSRASWGSPRTRGEKAVSLLLDYAARAGIQVHAVGLDKPDILYYLDEAICRQVAPAFPGWHAAQAELRNARSRMRWKRWVEDQYALSLTRESIRQLARRCRQEDKIPAELARKMHELTAYATAAKPET